MEIFFRVTGPLCGEFTGDQWNPSQRPVTRSIYVFFDLRLNKQLIKQSLGRWFESPSSSLWRHCSDNVGIILGISKKRLLWLFLNKIETHFIWRRECGCVNRGWSVLIGTLWNRWPYEDKWNYKNIYVCHIRYLLLSASLPIIISVLVLTLTFHTCIYAVHVESFLIHTKQRHVNSDTRLGYFYAFNSYLRF